MGETLEERDGITESVEEQLEEAFRGLVGPLNQEGNVIAYEPVWAIRTDRKASDEDIKGVPLYKEVYWQSSRFAAAQNVRILWR